MSPAPTSAMRSTRAPVAKSGTTNVRAPRAWSATLPAASTGASRLGATGRGRLVDRSLRSGAGHALLADGQSVARSDWGRPRRRQSLFRFDRGAGREDWHVEVAFSIHATRCVGLRRAGDAGADRCHLAEPAAQAAGAGQPQRIFLRA